VSVLHRIDGLLVLLQALMLRADSLLGVVVGADRLLVLLEEAADHQHRDDHQQSQTSADQQRIVLDPVHP
jgi:hypothetical protein